MASHITLSRALCLLGVFSVAALSSAFGREWEATVDAFAPGTFPQPRPVRAQYTFGWGGFSAATADIRLEKLNTGQLQFDSTGRSVGLVRTLWRYDVHNIATSDGQTFRPIQVKEVETTRSKQKTTELAFSPEGVTSVREERKTVEIKSNTQRFDFPNVVSINSALLFLRSQPLRDGESHRVVVYPATSPYLCTVTVIGHERVTVPTGNYEAIKLDLKISKVGKDRELLPHKKFRNATVWLSNDSDRLALRIEAQVFIGKVYAELESVRFDSANP